MKRIQVVEIGRMARELNNYPVLAGLDAEALLAMELEHYWDNDAVIIPVANEPHAYAVQRKPSLIGGKQTIFIRLVDVAAAEEDDTRELPAVVVYDQEGRKVS